MQEGLISESNIVSVVIVGITILAFMSTAIILFFYFSRKKIIQTELEKAQLAVAYQKQMLQETIVTQEEERQRIAQDMHDAISSKLNIVSLNANLLTEDTVTPQETKKLGNSIVTITTGVLESARRIAHDLLPPTLDKFGLQAAIEELCEQIEAGKKQTVTCNINYNIGLLQKEEELHLFRIVQELLNNTLKYANARLISVKLMSKENLVFLQYSDDGVGFQVNNHKKTKGLGISGIQNRAEILGAELTIQSYPGNGMSLTLEKKNTVNEY